MAMVRITVVGHEALNRAAFCDKQPGSVWSMLAPESLTCMFS